MTTHHAAPCGDLAHALPASATRTAAPSSYHPHALRAPAFELVTADQIGGAQ